MTFWDFVSHNTGLFIFFFVFIIPLLIGEVGYVIKMRWMYKERIARIQAGQEVPLEKEED